MKINLPLPLIRQYVIVIIVNFGALTAGISQSWSSPMIVKLTNGTDTPFIRPITEEEGSWIVSGGYLAAVGTNLIGGLLIDKLGRKLCIVLVSIPKLLFSIWTIFVTEVWMLILCRIVMTVCDCFVYLVIPVYVSEISCKEHRGCLCTLLHVMACAGIVIALGLGPFLSYTMFNSIIPILIALTSLPVLFLPDSPFDLYSKGCKEEAVKVLSLIRDSESIVMKEIEDYKLSKDKENINAISFLKNKLFRKSLFLGLLVCIGSNSLGCNAIYFYLQAIFESTKTSLSPEISSVIIGCIQLFAAFCTSFFTNNYGRRPILIYTVFGMFLGLVGLAIFFMISGTEGYVITGFLNYLPLVSLILFVYSFGVGLGNQIFVVTTELFDGQARAFGFSICLFASSLQTFLTSKYFILMTSAFGPAATYFFFSIMCLILILLIMLFLPETKGKTYSEIQTVLSRKLTHIQCFRRGNDKSINQQLNSL